MISPLSLWVLAMSVFFFLVIIAYFCSYCLSKNQLSPARVHAKVTSVMSDSLPPCKLWPARLLCPGDSPGKKTGVGCHASLQGIFPTRGSNLRLLHLLHQQASSLQQCHLESPALQQSSSIISVFSFISFYPYIYHFFPSTYLGLFFLLHSSLLRKMFISWIILFFSNRNM